ncbi:hypothetical protein Ahy_A05g023746 [Arachis hypogaea]|uniref:MULE transposase domain-containing protein n=1 Tax=Arachis hypogaea TaxID=3818 RepID=A0A445D4D1_ARAHY|nr:hypothetical protein Ahy_A05g023746 [Arachis hypogaea]
MYVCLSGCKNGFKAGCRRLIGLDGAFLKTQIGGQILSAVGHDANHHIYVIAWAIVDVENTENWKWFLELLHEDLGDYKENKWCFMSDMQKTTSTKGQEKDWTTHKEEKKGCRRGSAAAAAKAKSNPQENAASGSTVDPNTVTLPSQPPPDSAPQSVDMQEVEIDISQPNFSDAQESQEAPPQRPSKLQTRRKSSPPSGLVTMDPLQGASSATSFRLANFLKFVPTPGFKPPRKKK